MKKKKINGLLILLVVLIGVLIFLLTQLIRISNQSPSIEINVVSQTENEVDISINMNSSSTYYVCVDQNKQISDSCVFEQYSKDKTYELTNGIYYLHIQDKNGKEIENDIHEVYVLDYEENLDYPFYPIDDELEIDYKVIGINCEVAISSSDETVATINNNFIETKSKGNTTITISCDDLSDSFNLEVTDLYTTNDPDSASKPYLHTTICTQEEAHKLDTVLEKEIEEAGYGTRAGVVAAARFLALQFPYKITYFSESGRLDPDYSTNTDGEGRYYHKGLFLSEDKFDELGASMFGRATWGEYFEEDDSDDHSLDEFYLYDGFVPSDIGSHLYLSKRPNGLDCSGYVAWCYYNGGFDFGDIGAGGPGSGMAELGERVYISDELLQSDRIKAGDLVGYPGHIGIVIGVEEDYIWITDTLITGTKVTRYERNTESFEALGEDAWTYFMLMDSEYIEEGNYTAMWR